ncbi:MAG: hypothetical protein RLZ33_2181 [Bacteroidota bacterium]|jgi:hypothetical protein
MKRLLMLAFIFILSSCYSQEKAIIGHWVLEKTQDENGTIKYEKSSSAHWIIFEKNKTLKHGSFPDQISNTGSWEYDKKNNQIILIFDNSTKPEGDKVVWELEQLNKNTMIIGGKYPFIHFKKIKK